MADATPVLDYVLTSSGQLSTWALAVAGGSVAAVVSTSYRRPKDLNWRLAFLLFIPGWSCLAYSLYAGNALVGSFLASKMVRATALPAIAANINKLYDEQRHFLLYALAFFGVWLVAYLLVWTFTDNLEKADTR
jgi:hypothetical protein